MAFAHAGAANPASVYSGKILKKKDDETRTRARLIGSRVRAANEREQTGSEYKFNPIVRDQLLVSTRAINDTLLATLLEGC